MMLVIILACFVTGMIMYSSLPTMFVSHWNAQGVANGTMGKFWGVFIMPIIMLLLMGLWLLLPRVDPVAPEFKGFRYVYDFIFFLVIAFIAYVYAIMLGINGGLHLDLLQMILPALAAFMFILGALLPHLKRNWFVGIRTPWTISNDVVWRKTHRLGSVLFEAAAGFILAAAYLPRAATIWFILVPVLSAALISVVYSYFLYRKHERRA